jgi:hypothetical protein
LAQIVGDAIRPYRDDTLPSRLQDVEEEALQEARRAWAAHSAPVQNVLSGLTQEIQAIGARYQGRLEALNAELQAELAPFYERIELARHVEELQAMFRPALPARPDPDIDEPVEDGWLLDTQRGYLTQMAYYNARKAVNQQQPN